MSAWPLSAVAHIITKDSSIVFIIVSKR